MKIGILTFHRVLNYGAVLQAYGLQEYLKHLGHDVYIIDYNPEYLLKPYRIFQMDKYSNLPLLVRLKMFIRELLVMPLRIAKKIKFRDFVNKRLNLYSLDLNDANNDFDLFVLGSDQIWNSEITNGFDNVFWGNFPAAKGKKCITYAASAGDVRNVESLPLQKIQSFITNLTSISVRETKLANFLESTFHINVTLVIDPVLLAGRDCFMKLPRRKNTKSYLLLFQIYENDFVRKIAYDISRKMNLNIVEILSGQESLKNNKQQAVSVDDFVGYIKDADYVVTSSFHGTAFSILFKKMFNTVSVDSAIDVRAYSLLASLSLERKFVSKNELPDLSAIDYDAVEKKYLSLREKSESFFYNII